MRFELGNPDAWVRRELGTGTIYIRPQPAEPELQSLETAGPEAVEQSLSSGRWSKYTVVLCVADRLLFHADILNMAPLYYTAGGQKCSDTIDAGAGRALDELAMKQYFLAGYVTGSRTLFSDIRKSQAGEILWFGSDGVGTSKSFEYRYPPTLRAVAQRNAPDEAKRFGDLLDKAILRAVDSLQPGRQIVVPLSGGHDSRLLVSRLAALGIENVLCFSYGRADNEQSLISRRVAEALGYSWHFVEYTEEKWRALHEADVVEAYARFAFRGSSIPHLQDFLAIHELRHSGVVSRGDLCMPGHTLDFLSGGHVGTADFECDDAESAVNRVIQRHFPGATDDEIGEPELLVRIQALFEDFDGPPSQFQEWFNWRERQTKFIVNSCATYEFHGLQMALPFWDIDVVRYWLSVPPEIKAGRQFYFEMERHLLDPRLRDIPFASESKSKRSLSQRAQLALRKRMPTGLASRLVSLSRLRRQQNEGLNLAFAGLGEDIRSAVPHLAAHSIAEWPPIRDILCRRPYQLNGHRMAALYTLNLLLAQQSAGAAAS